MQDRYLLLNEIGRGGMGAVYLVQDLRFSAKLCVMKEMLCPSSRESDIQEAIQRFHLEADTLGLLRHPGIPYVIDRFHDQQRHYLVMEYVNGLDLKKALQLYMEKYGEAFQVDHAMEYMYRLALILDYIHTRVPVVIHRDIKPANIIIDTEGQLKLVDFGISKSQNQRGHSGIIGTIGYAPPEQLKGFCDERSDIYSLGMTIHHLLTGKDPTQEWNGEVGRLRAKNPAIPAQVDDLIHWMTQPNPSARPARADIIVQQLTMLANRLEPNFLLHSRKDSPLHTMIEQYLSTTKMPETRVVKACHRCRTKNLAFSQFCKECGQRF
ncbi:serine/threonine protein kinase [Brevibacillus fluminis]|uniref:serine/threonine protein kinase n=1 Tax=Brevibacillus fluminis TaxID=511487 RepID=UPI003F88BF8D